MVDAVPVKVTDMRNVVATAVRVAMSRIGLDHARLATRMAALGQPWHRQTVGSVTRGVRRVSAEELLPLSLALECAMSELLSPADPAHRNTIVEVTDSAALPAAEVERSAGDGTPSIFVYWEDDQPRFAHAALVRATARKIDRSASVRRRELRDTAAIGVQAYDERAMEEQLLTALRPIRDRLRDADLGNNDLPDDEGLRQLIQDEFQAMNDDEQEGRSDG